MSNSVVKVTDSMLNDSLLLLVGEDGTVSPDKTTVENYLNSKSGATDIQVMHINKSDGDSIDVSIDNLTYIPDIDAVEEPQQTQQQQEPETNPVMDEIARNLYNVRLDHDYTPLTVNEEANELAKTLSILDGESHKASTSKIKNVQKNDQSIKTIKPKPEQNNKINTNINNKLQTRKMRPKLKLIRNEEEDDDDDEDYDDEDEEEEEEDDSDYEMEESTARRTKRTRQRIVKTKSIKQQHKTPPKPIQIKQKESEKIEKLSLPPSTPTQTALITTEDKSPVEKKPVKKEKKPPKPIPDDFALFSTPDIIRRVGGGKDTQQSQPVTTTTPQTPEIERPAKIEQRSKSAQESPQNTIKTIGSRMSLDGKIDKSKSTIESKKRKTSLDMKRVTNDVKKQEVSMKFPNNNNSNNNNTNNNSGDNDNLDMPSAEEIRDIMNAENNLDNNDLNSGDQTLDGGGLDIDPSLLENLNNDLISEDILYQVAQSLVSNTELQNAIDKSINEGNLVLDPSIIQQQDQAITQNESTPVQESSTNSTQKGTQIVRPDGRIVVIPPIERPTTRSRNKNKEIEQPVKPTHKPLDEEHVSGNELDSSGDDDEDEEEESEDDPNKLWCICNQPHNNRFMICCDTCEEWYHGKCVNITKAMGQQMESEGKEWICLFCKDPQLKRPQAAARRIRKASRNSRQSSDSTGSTKVPEGGSVPCVVCQKQSRINSIFCSEACILAHAQGVERVVVFERATGNMLTGNKAPSAANLEQWLKEHPGYEVVRSAGKVVTAKQTQQNFTQSKLKFMKKSDNNGVSIAVQKKGVNVGVLKYLPKSSTPSNKASTTTITGTPTTKGNLKIISKQLPTTPQQKPIQQKPNISQTTKTANSTTTATATSTTTPNTTPNRPKLNQSGRSPSTPTNKDKPMPIKTPKSRQAEITPQPKQENIRENVQKTLFEQLTNRLKMVDDLKLTEDEVKNISNEIESQLYKCFGDTGQKYRNKYRSLIFNIKDIKNQTLWRRICEKSINPYQLVRLSPDDLASQELALWREREAKHQLDMIKKSELELLNCNRQYVLKTHKGEQVLEENRPSADNIDTTEVITSLTEADDKDSTAQPTSITTTTKSEHSKEHSNNKKTSKHSHRDKDHKSSKDKERHRSSSKDRSRRRSRSRDHSRKRSSERKRSRSRDKHRKSSSTSSSSSSHKSSRHRKEGHSTTTTTTTDKLDKKSKEILEQLVDNKIVPPLEDRLWKHVPQEDIIPAPVAESDSDHEPTSTVSIPTPPRSSETDDTQTNQSVTAEIKEKPSKEEKPVTEERSSASPPLPPPVPQQPTKAQTAEIWRGVINMVDVAQISITAHEVSGDCNGLGTELPSNLDIVGRIAPDIVWDYIGKMKCSNSKIISLVRLNAINVEEKMPYLALYSYLSSRNRLGVVKPINKAVKDFYILPLSSQKPIPPALLPITGPGFEESRPALLLGIIVRDKRKRPLSDTNTAINVKKTKIEPPVQTQRSYTPPPVKDSKLKLPLPPPVGDEDDDEPYSPEDSDPDSMATPLAADVASGSSLNTSFLDTGVASSFQPFSNKFDNIPGLGNPVLPSSTQELQRQMEKLNKEIEMQKSEINSISQNIATASTEIGSSALANINLPSNLQQILDSIKTISAVSNTETQEIEPEDPSPVKEKSPDLTIPLMLPTNFSRPLQQQQNSDDSSPGTIPLNLPNKKKPTTDLDKSNNGSNSSSNNSVLGLLSEEDLIKKAAEMLGETNDSNTKEPPVVKTAEAPVKTPISFSFTNSLAKRPKLEHPPLPGLDDE